MTAPRAWLLFVTAAALSAAAACDTDSAPDAPRSAAGAATTAGSGGSDRAGSAGTGGSVAPAIGGSGVANTGGALDTGGTSGDAGGAAGHDQGGEFPAECGDPRRDGVLVYEDVTRETTWSCPLYTLTQPIYVHSSSAETTVLHIAPGVTVRGVKGAEPVKLPGALIVTRSGRLEAVGTKEAPIVFTTTEPSATAQPGSWGGLMLLGRARVNAPVDFEASGKPAGEVYAEALPRTELGLYGWPRDLEGSGGGGAGGEGAGGQGNGGEAGAGPSHDTPSEYDSWSCGTLKFARIHFAGFKAGSAKELNGLTLAGCGSDTIVDHVQVHRSSDDGIEIFGGSVNVSHVVLTGNQDDALDWDQGWRGQAQFVAIQTHDDADSGDSCGIEADGYATPDAPVGLASSPRLWNVTMILSKSTQRGIRLRDGTEGFVRNALLVSHADGVPKGLIDIDHALTADALATGSLSVQNSIFRGNWPVAGQADSLGNVYLEQDVFTGAGVGAYGNDVVASASDLWPNAFNTSAPDWVPPATSLAADNAAVPSEADGKSFVDTTARYRGAFVPGGDDWASGWTQYP